MLYSANVARRMMHHSSLVAQNSELLSRSCSAVATIESGLAEPGYRFSDGWGP